jgi:2,4-dienoyl-CoA reductase-like NADH-dependent reductase (Old Yellow Enzyme family)
MAALAKPVELGPLTLKNRIFMSALTRSRAVPTNVPNDLMREYYKQRSGAGLIITEGTLITQQG